MQPGGEEGPYPSPATLPELKFLLEQGQPAQTSARGLIPAANKAEDEPLVSSSSCCTGSLETGADGVS